MTTAFKLRNGTILLSTEAPGGIYNAAQLKKIASLCEGEAAIVKATEDQRLALCVKPEQAASIAQELKAIGLGIRHYQDGLHQPTSCIGELCPDHEQDALGSALDISQHLEELKLNSPLKIGINGCARCCVPCHTLDISVVGDASGYRMSLGGKNSQLPEMASFMAEGIPHNELPGLIRKVIEIYQTHAEADESLQSVIERVGATDFISALAPYSQDAAGDSDPFAAPAEIEVEAPTSMDEPALSETPDAEFSTDDLGTDDLALDELSTEDLGGGELALDDTPVDLELSEGTVDTSSESFDIDTMDIDPKATNLSGDISSEIAIGGESESIPEIALSSDFGEDNLDIPTNISDEGELPESIDNSPTFINGASLETLEDLAEDLSTEDTSALLLADEDLDLVETKIDVSDVMKAPVQVASPAPQEVAPVAEAEANAPVAEVDEVVSEEDENILEQQLTASIAAQGQLLDHSGTDDEREKALELLGDSETSLEDEHIDETMSQEDHSFDNTEIEDEAPTFTEVMVSDDDDLEIMDDDDHDAHDHLPLSEIVGTVSKSNSVTSLPKRASGPSQKPQKGWTFSGLDVDASGFPVISFQNGVQITLTEEAVMSGELNIGGHTLTLSHTNGGIEMQMDGMKMFLPRAA